jgi:hypothetical protein
MKRGLTWLTVQSVALATIGLYYARTARAEDQGSIRPVRAKQYLAAWRQPRLAHPSGAQVNHHHAWNSNRVRKRLHSSFFAARHGLGKFNRHGWKA